MPRPAGRATRNMENRAADTRQQQRRMMPEGRVVAKLYVPAEEIPAGMRYSWIDVGYDNDPNVVRADEQGRKGWVPVPRSRHPRFAYGQSLIPGREQTDPYAQFIKVGASLLCERPEDEVVADKRAEDLMQAEQVRSISRWQGGQGVGPEMPAVENDARFGFKNEAPEYDHRASFKKDA